MSSEKVENRIEEVKRFLEEADKKADFEQVGNSVLYDLCKKHPNHNNHSEIIAKVWLIGRSYAVSIERNHNNKFISDDFFVEVAKIFIENNFDNFLDGIKNLSEIKEKNIGTILKTHKNIVDFINEKITKDNKRSFVSKYLHFHFPNLFFIYDSRVNREIGKVFKEIGRSKKDVDIILSKLDKYDENYADFFIKCFYLSKFYKENKINLNTRQIDSFLIQKANPKIQEYKNKKLYE